EPGGLVRLGTVSFAGLPFEDRARMLALRIGELAHSFRAPPASPAPPTAMPEVHRPAAPSWGLGARLGVRGYPALSGAQNHVGLVVQLPLPPPEPLELELDAGVLFAQARDPLGVASLVTPSAGGALLLKQVSGSWSFAAGPRLELGRALARGL